MKGGTVQIVWHGGKPILSVDFHLPTGLLATAGADHNIRFWSLHRTEKSKSLPSATVKGDFSYHNTTANVLRFSPSGELLASGAGNGDVLIWRIIQADGEIPSLTVWKLLRSHVEDVLDLEWSPDGTLLVSGSVDNTSIIWNIQEGTPVQVIKDHQHYVQGVTWDPAGKYVASLSGDRTCRIYSLRSPTKRGKAKDKNARSDYTCRHILCKKEVAAGSAVATSTDVDVTLQKKVPSSKQYLFYDENLQSFFRRLSWSPDGSFLLIPSGIEKLSSEAGPCSVSYIVSRNDLSRPALQLPAASKPVVAARFCRVLFKKSCKPDTNEPGVGAFKLPYKLIFAVATLNSVFIYDTEQSCPVAIFAGLHYASITDLAWSFDAKFLAVSSQDGYCTLVGFDEGDLGTPLPLEDLPSEVASLLPHSRPASTQADSCVVSPIKDPSRLPVDPPLSESVELPRRMAVPERDPAAGVRETPISSSAKSFKKQSDGQVKTSQPRRINPKPISEYLVKSAVPPSDPSGTTGDSGGLEVRGNQSHADVPSTASHGFEVQSGYRIDKDRKLDGVDSPVGVSSSAAPRASTPVCEAVDKETSELWELQKCSTSICRGAESHKMAELSNRDQRSVQAESERGPSSIPVREDHALAPGVNLRSSEKPRDPDADIYVRPLKCRRISPKAISDDIDKPTAHKPVSSEASLPLPRALQKIQVASAVPSTQKCCKSSTQRAKDENTGNLLE